MGCDIHLNIEVKINGAWEHYAQLEPGRTYTMFGAMAGVRRNESLFGEPKGIPADCSVLTRFNVAQWAGDGHSHSWLGREEIMRLETFFDDYIRQAADRDRYSFERWLGTYLYGDGFGSLEVVDDVRFVFFFDN